MATLRPITMPLLDEAWCAAVDGSAFPVLMGI